MSWEFRMKNIILFFGLLFISNSGFTSNDHGHNPPRVGTSAEEALEILSRDITAFQEIDPTIAHFLDPTPNL